jgi:2-polyprenyl-3-methyl-5-hydroxy-6-metoxy-1,4-benzoquinol methylase
MSGQREITNCICCGSNQLNPLKSFENASLVKCASCSMVFSSRNPTIVELENHYQGYGRNDYLSPITIKRYNEILDQFEKVRKTNRLLDVGCGIGYFLEVAKKRGWEVYGTEFTDEAIRICQTKGIQMHQGVLNPQNYSLESFDVITSFEVIEHINTPNAEMKNITSLLRKGGCFYVTTPNFNSLLRYYLGPNYNVIGWPEHLSYYTPKTLTSLMLKHGFRKRWVKSTGVSITRFLTSRTPVKSLSPEEGTEFISANTEDEKLRNNFESNAILSFAKKTLNSFLTISGKGDALKGLFQKH